MNDVEKTTEYFSWIGDLKKRYRATQIKAAISVNTALLEFYWSLGKDISEKYALEASYGSSFFKKLSADLKIAIPDASGLSVRNLKYCQDFFCLYASKVILPQVVAKLLWRHIKSATSCDAQRRKRFLSSANCRR